MLLFNTLRKIWLHHLLQYLGGLAEKFPSVATATVTPILSRFLLEPAPLLTKLSGEFVSFDNTKQNR